MTMQHHATVKAERTISLAFVWTLAVIVASFSVGLAQQRHLTVRVLLPSSTPKDASIYIVGDAPSLGNWDPGAIPMIRRNDSLWAFTGAFPDQNVVAFKITRGSWETEALYVDGVVPQNTMVQLKSDTTIVLEPVSWNDISPAKRKRTSGGGIVGDLRYHRGIKGEGLKYDRDVLVWLPPSYEKEPQRRYPVLYMHDGQNVFDPKTSFLGYDWRADEVADSMIRAGALEEIIIVGINNTPDRIEEYTHTPLGRNYAKFVVERVKPMIDSLYRTKSSRDNTAVMGSSLGGIVSLLFVWWYPDVFSMAGCLSTAIGPSRDGSLLQEMREYHGPKKNLRVYLDVGGLESSLIPVFNQFVTTLQDLGYQRGRDLEYFLDEGAQHNELAWAHRLWRPLKFFFGR